MLLGALRIRGVEAVVRHGIAFGVTGGKALELLVALRLEREYGAGVHAGGKKDAAGTAFLKEFLVVVAGDRHVAADRLPGAQDHVGLQVVVHLRVVFPGPVLGKAEDHEAAQVRVAAGILGEGEGMGGGGRRFRAGAKPGGPGQGQRRRQGPDDGQSPGRGRGCRVEGWPSGQGPVPSWGGHQCWQGPS